MPNDVVLINFRFRVRLKHRYLECMDILANIKELGEQRLYLVPDSSEPDRKFYLVPSLEDLDSPKATLILTDKNGKAVFDIVGENQFYFYEEQEKIDFTDRLDALANDVREALKQGVDLSSLDIPEHAGKMKPYDPELIDVRDSPMSVFQAYTMINDNDINLSPDFQRNIVWVSKRKSRLIESILLRIPIPVFYFSQGKNGRLSVVDGLQRLTAIKSFMDNSLKLSELEYLTELNGLTYADLQKKYDLYWRRFKLTKLSANIIQPGSPTKVRYDIFRRLNTGGRPLNNQELRNCMASPSLRKALKAMAHSSEFMDATGHSIDDVRMQAQEMVLRFMRFWYWMKLNGSIDEYKGEMDTVLDDFTDEVSLIDNFPFVECETDFKNAMINASHLFGRHAFRKVFKGFSDDSPRSLINKALFLAFSVVLSRFNPKDVRNKASHGEWITRLADVIDNNTPESLKIMKLISYGTNGPKNIKEAFSVAEKLAEALN